METKTLSKATPITIGLVIVFVLAAFWSGNMFATINSKLDSHVEQDVHKGVIENYVQKTEMELQFRLLREEIKSSSLLLKAEMERLNDVVEKLEAKTD